MKLHIIGVGGPRPSQRAYGCCCVLESGGDFIMFDCGPGSTYKMTRMGLSPTQVNTLFITHHHTDHNVDFPCFALLRFDLDNGDLPPLSVYGPKPTEEFVKRLVGNDGAWTPDITSRRQHPVALHNYLQRGGALPRPSPEPHAYDLESGAVIRNDSWTARAVAVPHLEPYLNSLAYRIDTEEGSLLFLGDAGIGPELVELAEGVDTVVTGILSWNTRLGDPLDPHHNVSADIPDIVDLTMGAGLSRVVGIHGSPSSQAAETSFREGYNGLSYKGKVICPEELTTIEL